MKKNDNNQSSHQYQRIKQNCINKCKMTILLKNSLSNATRNKTNQHLKKREHGGQFKTENTSQKIYEANIK